MREVNAMNEVSLKAVPISDFFQVFNLARTIKNCYFGQPFCIPLIHNTQPCYIQLQMQSVWLNYHSVQVLQVDRFPRFFYHILLPVSDGFSCQYVPCPFFYFLFRFIEVKSMYLNLILTPTTEVQRHHLADSE